MFNMKLRIQLYALCFLLIANTLKVKADEGMWLLALLDKFNITAMQAKGLKLSAEDIYSINKASLKDAVVIFGRGCTGEMVSADGLLLTNFHCGRYQIQSHSTLDNDLLTNGFWARSKEEELPNKGLSVTFLVRMEDVTETTLNGVTDNMSQVQREAKIAENSIAIEKKAIEGTVYRAIVQPLFYGNQYYLFVYKEYRDIRLVAAAPTSVGNFGGDTDNWMWPRHAGDFSIFRVYAGKDNEPKEYSKDNVPFKPKKFLSISLKGVKEGDFTMVMGYPAGTQQFLTAHAIKNSMEKELPCRIAIRGHILDIMAAAMHQNDSVRLAYTSRYYGISNAWKKWEGSILGLKRTNALQKKADFESRFQAWLDADAARKSKYSPVLKTMDSCYSALEPYIIPAAYYEEAIATLDLWPLLTRFMSYISPAFAANSKPTENTPEALKKYTDGFFTSYRSDLDKKTTENMLDMYQRNVSHDFYPEAFSVLTGKYKGDIKRYTEYLYAKSAFSSKNKLMELAGLPVDKLQKKLEKDPFFELYKGFVSIYVNKIQPDYIGLNARITNLYRLYVKAIMEMQKDKIFYPDANFTMRVAYGKAEGYQPKDAIQYEYSTTLDGMMQKEDPSIADYKVPEKLHQLYNAKDFGQYGVNGTMPVCFIASNHTSGGNSGSPVLDANGNLIGINFDRNWEGTMSDINYDSSICRNISVDIRYVLFIIDKLGGGSNLIAEMNIIK
jgi:hypothetical protein